MSEAPAPTENVKAPGKTRSPIERIVVWVGIVLLIVVVFVEYMGQKNYNAAMTWFEENEYRGKTLADVREAAVGASESDYEIAVKSVPLADSGDAAEDVPGEIGKSFRWMSLFKKYELVATFQGEGDAAVLTGFYNPELLKQVNEEMAAKYAEQESVEMPDDLDAMEAGMQAGGGGGSSADSDADAMNEDTADETDTETEPDTDEK